MCLCNNIYVCFCIFQCLFNQQLVALPLLFRFVYVSQCVNSQRVKQPQGVHILIMEVALSWIFNSINSLMCVYSQLHNSLFRKIVISVHIPTQEIAYTRQEDNSEIWVVNHSGTCNLCTTRCAFILFGSYMVPMGIPLIIYSVKNLLCEFRFQAMLIKHSCDNEM